MYKDMNHEELVSLHDDLCKQYEQVKAKGLKLNMARGKPDVMRTSFQYCYCQIFPVLGDNSVLSCP